MSVNESASLVRCATHGLVERVISCIHVRSHKVAELFIVPADTDGEAMAWCETCEAARIADRGWYDQADAVAQWAFICSGCFGRIVQSHENITSYTGEVTPEHEPEP